MRFLPILLLAGWFVPAASAAPNRHVVLITIDGFPAYLFHDPKASLPNIRQLAAQGVEAEGMRVSSPSVTWPNHTTIVTGVNPARHSVLYNGVLELGGPGLPVKIDPNRDKADLVAVPTIYDRLHAAGFRTAAINWPCTRNVTTLDDNFPDVPDNLANTTPRLRQELVARGVLASESDAAFDQLSGAARDEVWVQAACEVIRRRKPHLLYLHLLNTDGVHHRYGPSSPASYTAIALADAYVGRLLGALDEAGIRSKTTVFVTADHGFATATNVLHPNVLLRRAGLLQLGASNQIVSARAQVVPEGGMGMVYLTNPATRDEDRRKVLELFEGQEGVARVLQPVDYAAYGFPLPDRNRRMSDLVIAAKDGYAVAGIATGENFVNPAGRQTNLGYHGYLADNPRMNATLVVAGRGIKRGAKIGMVSNLDLAPTVARLLGQTLPNVDGEVLAEILDSGK
ncbi:MAG TPA: alkaline phosphatase family protein [Verrucomicrobiae bacterium]|nr:alkaline phosphatase family protein [Verrucomicrobiae bacterium]